MTERDGEFGRTFERLGPTVLAAAVLTGIEPLASGAGLLLLCYLPGRLLSRACGLARTWDRTGSFILHVCLSLAITPVLLNPIWHYTNERWRLLGFVWALLTTGAFLLPRERRDETEARRRCFEGRTAKIVFAAAIVFIAIAVIGPYWPTELNGSPMPSLIHDFIKHHAVLYSLEQRPAPLGNPFFADEAAGPVYYYHFFYLAPATLRAWSNGLSLELAFGLQSALVGIGLTGLFFLIIKRFAGGERPATLGILLATAVGGLDIIPLVLLRQATVTLDAWADHAVRIHSLLTQLVWSPQNMLGVLVVMVAVYLLSSKVSGTRWLWLGALLGASLLGSSVWIAAGILPALTLYALFDVWGRRGIMGGALRCAGGYVITAVLMAAASATSWLGYLEMSQRHGKGLTFEWPHQTYAFLGQFAPPGVLANLLDLSWVLAVEMGPLLLFPLLTPRRIWLRAWQDDGLRLLLIGAVTAVAGYTTVRSHFTYNDFGQKIMLIALSCGTVLAACVLSDRGRPATLFNPFGWRLHDQSPERPRRAAAWIVGIVLLLGLPQAFYQAPITAIRRYIPASSPLRMFREGITARSEKEAGGGRFLRYGTPTDSVIQGDVGTERMELAQIARRQIGVTILERDSMVFFPADVAAHDAALADVRKALETPLSAEQRRELLAKHGITHVYLGALERERWQGWEAFEDARCFICVYRDDETAVYALKTIERG